MLLSVYFKYHDEIETSSVGIFIERGCLVMRLGMTFVMKFKMMDGFETAGGCEPCDEVVLVLVLPI